MLWGDDWQPVRQATDRKYGQWYRTMGMCRCLAGATRSRRALRYEAELHTQE